MIKFPAFNEQNTKTVNVNKKANIYKVFGAGSDSFKNYYERFLENGYELKEKRENGGYLYAAFIKDNEGVFLNYFCKTDAVYIVAESDCNYFELGGGGGAAIVAPQVTQLTQEDYGMSYVVRLSDGRFIIIDGGNNFEPDIDRLMNCLRAGANGEKPVIACWIMSHEHCDHYQCYIGFDDKYAGEYEVQSFMLNFMELDDERFPEMDNTDHRLSFNTSNRVNVPIMFEKMEKSGAPIYMAHTGQVYNIGDARIEMLSSLDETVDYMKANINCTSLVFKMSLGGQTILWTGDSTFDEAKLTQRYGEYLKSDILQVPHHGFEGPSDPEKEVEGYALTDAHTCMIPVSEMNAFTKIDTFRNGPRYLYEFSNAVEIIVGEDNKTLTLPYTPAPYKRNEFKAKFREGLTRNGATTWVFNNLNFENEEDVTFSFLNMCNKKATVCVEVYFLDGSKNLGDIKIELTGGLQKINITDKENTITDSVWFSWMSPDVKGYPESGEFAVRFISDIPIVVSNKNQKATYTSELNV